MAFVVVYDACVLYPAPLRDLLMRIASAGVVRARWSEQILDECFGSLVERRPDLDPAGFERTRQLMCSAVPDSLVTGYEDLIEGLTLPDPDDRHVLAAAIRAGAQAIVTFNLKDFPNVAMEPYGIEAKHPDLFVVDSIDISPEAAARVVQEQAAALRNPPRTSRELLDILENQGLRESVVRLRGLVQ